MFLLLPFHPHSFSLTDLAACLLVRVVAGRDAQAVEGGPGDGVVGGEVHARVAVVRVAPAPITEDGLDKGHFGRLEVGPTRFYIENTGCPMSSKAWVGLT